MFCSIPGSYERLTSSQSPQAEININFPPNGSRAPNVFDWTLVISIYLFFETGNLFLYGGKGWLVTDIQFSPSRNCTRKCLRYENVAVYELRAFRYRSPSYAIADGVYLRYMGQGQARFTLCHDSRASERASKRSSPWEPPLLLPCTDVMENASRTSLSRERYAAIVIINHYINQLLIPRGIRLFLDVRFLCSRDVTLESTSIILKYKCFDV